MSGYYGIIVLKEVVKMKKGKIALIIIIILCILGLTATACYYFKFPKLVFNKQNEEPKKEENNNKKQKEISEEEIESKIFDLKYFLTQSDFDTTSEDSNYFAFFTLYMPTLDIEEDGSIDMDNFKNVYKRYFDADNYISSNILNYYDVGIKYIYEYDEDSQKLVYVEDGLTEEMEEEAEKNYLTPYSYYSDFFITDYEFKDEKLIVKAQFVINTENGKFYKTVFDLKNDQNSYYQIETEDGLVLSQIEQVYEQFKKELPIVTIKFKLSSYGEYVFDEVSAEY